MNAMCIRSMIAASLSCRSVVTTMLTRKKFSRQRDERAPDHLEVLLHAVPLDDVAQPGGRRS